jgi:SAM-dependent methyltransferase
MRMSAAYDPVAALYDQHWGREFAAVAKAALETHLLPLLPPGSAVLDLCCGTGLILADLDQRGFRTFGVDESPKMLAIARDNAPRSALQQADMAAFHWDIRFSAVVSFYNSLNHAQSLDHLRATLLNVVKHLDDGGLLLFDYVLPEAFESSWEWCEQIDDEAGARTLRYSYERSSGHANLLINQQDLIRQTSFQPRQIRDALKAAGLAASSETPMINSSPVRGRRLLVARKQ